MIDGGSTFTGSPDPDEVAPPTTTVCTLVAIVAPCAFVAVSSSRIVDPTSAACTTYVVPVAPPMSEHDAPDALQRRHFLVTDVGAPFHDPATAVGVAPSTGVPVIRGSCVFAGGDPGSGGGAADPPENAPASAVVRAVPALSSVGTYPSRV